MKSLILAAAAFTVISSAAFACSGPLCTSPTPVGPDGAFGAAAVTHPGTTTTRISRSRAVANDDGSTTYITLGKQVTTNVYKGSSLYGTIRQTTNCPPSASKGSKGGQSRGGKGAPGNGNK